MVPLSMRTSRPEVARLAYEVAKVDMLVLVFLLPFLLCTPLVLVKAYIFSDDTHAFLLFLVLMGLSIRWPDLQQQMVLL
jgi:hypothetical protein